MLNVQPKITDKPESTTMIAMTREADSKDEATRGATGYDPFGVLGMLSDVIDTYLPTALEMLSVWPSHPIGASEII